MTHLESLACGVPNIAPDTSSMTELITDDQFESMNRGWLANISTYHEIPDGSERDLVDVRDLMLKMKMAYVEKEKMETFSENGMKWAKQYNWDRIVSIWDELLKSYPYKIGK
jgi:glycosyltransferase involved in cell wall biosynthesis